MDTSSLLIVIFVLTFTAVREFMHSREIRERDDASYSRLKEALDAKDAMIRDLEVRIQSNSPEEYIRMKDPTPPENMKDEEVDFIPIDEVDIDKLVEAVTE